MVTEDGRQPDQATTGPGDARAAGLRLARHTDLLAPVWDHRVTLVVGPAGSGKSTLVGRLAQEALARGPVAVHRPAVDEQSVPAVLSALRARLLAALDQPDEGRPWVDPAEAIRRLARLPGPLLVVVDDAHLLDGSPAGAALHALVVSGPPQVRWVVATRWEPSQDLSGLRLRGDLHEIRADDLRFRSWEVEQLFTHWYGQPLPPEEMAELARVSEGWAAGLHLFHLATVDRSAGTRRRILRSLGTRATVRDYLSRNVLDHLSPRVRSFLVRTSPLDLLTGPLCDDLLGTEGSLEVLRDLQASSLFTQEVGDDAWRYHDVFGSFLRALLEEEVGAEEAAAWHRRAGDLLAAAGQADAALVAYSRAQAWEPMLGHLRATGADPDPRGGGWVGALPASLAADPVVALAVARAQVTRGELGAALEAYRAAEDAGLPGPLRTPARRERSAVASWVTDDASPPEGWVALAHAAVRHDPRRASRDALRLGGDHGGLVAGLLAVLAGDLERSVRLLDQVDASPDATPVEHALAALALSTVQVIYGRGERDIRRCASEADALGVGWLSEVARSLVVVADPGAPVERVADVMERRRGAGDPVGAAIAAIVVVLGRMVHEARPDPRRPGSWRGRGPEAETVWSDWLDAAATDARRVGAATLEAWARAIAALLAVRRADPEARAAALAAEHLARSAEVPGARAVAFAALGAGGGPSAAEHLRLAEELASSCLGGLPRGFRRMIDWAVAPARGAAALDPLLGRQRELDDLLRQWRGADEEGAAVRVTGHAGSGISTLLVHLAEQVRDRGGPVVWIDGSAAHAGDLWSTMARRWPTEAGPLAWSDDHGWVDLEVVSAVEAAAATLGEAADAEAAAEALGALIALSGRTRPVLIVVDHVRLLDPSGRALLAHLVPRVRELPVMVAMGHRSPSSPDLRSLTPAEVRLEALDGGALGDLLVVRGLSRDAASVGSLLWLTGGLPALVHEVLASVTEPSPRRSRPEVGPPWSTDRAPRSARRLADDQIDELGPDRGAVLRAAAVLGATVAVDALAAAVDLPRDEVDGAVAAAVELGLVRRSGDGATRFSVPAVTEHLAARLSDAERIDLRLAAADHHAADPAGAGAEAAQLLGAALLDRSRVDGHRLSEVVARAVDQAVARGDVAGAVALGSTAADLLGDGDPARSVALQLALARAHRVRDGGRAHRLALRAAGRAALVSGDDEAMVRVAVEVAVSASEAGLDDEDHTIVARAAGLRGEATAGPASVLAAWLAAQRPSGSPGDVEALASQADDACAWAETRDPRLAALALAAWHDTQWDAGAGPARATTARGVAAAAQRAGDVDLGLTASRLARSAALEVGDAVAADVELARYRRLAAERPAGAAAWWAAAARAGRALLDGRFDDADERMEAAGSGGPPGVSTLVGRVHDVVVGRDAAGPAERMARFGSESGAPLGEDVTLQLAGRALDAWVAARSGDAAAAGLEVGRFVSASLAQVPRGPRWLPTMVWLAEAAAEVGDVERAAALYRELLPWAGRLVVVETVLVWGSADHALGRLALCLGAHDDAVGHLDAAVDLAQRLGSLSLSASAQLDAGRAYFGRDAAGDRARGRMLVATALDGARSAGMTSVVAAGERLLADDRTPVPLGAVDAAATGQDAAMATEASGPAPAAAPRVVVRCLGPFELVIDEHAVDLARVRPRARSVLWYLAARGGELVNRQQIAADLWSDRDEASARRSLQVAVSSRPTLPRSSARENASTSQTSPSPRARR